MTTPLASHLNDREYQKFDKNSKDETAVRTIGETEVTNAAPAGYSSFIYTAVEINDTSWTELPPSPSAVRASVGIQNDSGEELRLRNTDDVPDYVSQGWRVFNNGEFFMDTKGAARIFAKAKTGTRVIGVMELIP